MVYHMSDLVPCELQQIIELIQQGTDDFVGSFWRIHDAVESGYEHNVVFGNWKVLRYSRSTQFINITRHLNTYTHNDGYLLEFEDRFVDS